MVRAVEIAVLAWMGVGLAGCQQAQKDKPVWEQVKVGDLATAQKEKAAGPQALKTINFDVHIYEIPAEKAGRVNGALLLLREGPLRFYSRRAFEANLFAAGFGQIKTWGEVHDLLVSAGGHKAFKAALLLTDNQEQDLMVTGIVRRQEVTHVSAQATREKVTIGPGAMALRIKAQKTPQTRGVCSMVAYPVFTAGVTTAVPELAARAKRQEVEFKGAGFGLKMGVGDVVMLGPREYVEDLTMLPGRFFSNPEGVLFLNEATRRRPEWKKAVRVFMLVCTAIND